MKRKILFSTLGVLFLVVGIVVGGFWYMSTQPLYKPGMLRDGQGLRVPLVPPTRPTDSGTWLVDGKLLAYQYLLQKDFDKLLLERSKGS